MPPTNRRAAAKEFDEQRRKGQRKLDEPPEKPVVHDMEIFIVTTKLKMCVGIDPASDQAGFLKKDQRVAIRRRETVPQVPPVDRLQVATPMEVEVLGWINAEKNGEPTLAPEPPPAVEDGGAAVAAEGVKPALRRMDTESFVKTRKMFAGFWNGASAALFTRVFGMGGETIDKSDAALASRFAEVDADGSGAISDNEMKAYMLSVYGPSLDKKIVKTMMQMADTNGDGEVDLEEFKDFMRAMPDKSRKKKDKDDRGSTRISAIDSAMEC